MNRMNSLSMKALFLSCDPCRSIIFSSARFNELLQVSAEVTLAKKASLTFEQLITRGDDVLCTSIIRIACLDANTMRPKAIPENLLELLKNEH